MRGYVVGLFKVVTVILVMTLPTLAYAAGIGSKFKDFENEWNKGYKQEFGDDVRIGYNKKRSIAYSKSDSFDGKVAYISGELWGMFGADGNSLPTQAQFAKGIRSMMPSDSKLISKYVGDRGYKQAMYIFKSETLSRMKGIDTLTSYKIDKNPKGLFFLKTTHDVSNENLVINFHLIISSGDRDRDGMKKVKATFP